VEILASSVIAEVIRFGGEDSGEHIGESSGAERGGTNTKTHTPDRAASLTDSEYGPRRQPCRSNLGDLRFQSGREGRRRIPSTGPRPLAGEAIPSTRTATPAWCSRRWFVKPTPPFPQFQYHITGVPWAANVDFRITTVLCLRTGLVRIPVLLIRVRPAELLVCCGTRSIDYPTDRKLEILYSFR